MRRLLVMIALSLSAPSLLFGQARPNTPSDTEQVALQKIYLMADLKALNEETSKLYTPLARASAKAEIADAAWTLDQGWAKALLREAYELSLPPVEERERQRSRPAGSDPIEPNKMDFARGRIRNRVLGIAQRDKSLVAQLTELGAQQLGKIEEVNRFSVLSVRAIEAGDMDAAGDYLLKAIEADPTQIALGLSILEVAAQDRELADKLLIQYIARLRSTPLTRNSALRIYIGLRRAVFPNINMDPKRRPIPPAGRAAIQAYVGYVLESMARLERSEPGSAKNLRGFLLSVWLPLNQHAPELLASFTALEALSRTPGDNAELPTQNTEESDKTSYEERVKKALDSRLPADLEAAFNYALGREDFAKAREIHSRLPDGVTKDRLGEELNVREAIRLASKGELAEAERFARLLIKPQSVLRAYPMLIDKYVAGKDKSHAATLALQAVNQLKTASDNSTLPFVLSRLSAATAAADAVLALEVLDEAVKAANRSDQDTDDGRTNLYLETFTLLAPQGETRVRQSAENLKDRLRRINALAIIYRWKAQELSKKEKPSVGM